MGGLLPVEGQYQLPLHAIHPGVTRLAPRRADGYGEREDNSRGAVRHHLYQGAQGGMSLTKLAIGFFQVLAAKASLQPSYEREINGKVLDGAPKIRSELARGRTMVATIMIISGKIRYRYGYDLSLKAIIRDQSLEKLN